MSINKEYFILQPSKFKLDGGAMYGIIPKPLWEQKSPPDEQNRIDLALRLLLIKTEIEGEKRNIIIDTGIGDYHPEKFQSMFDIRTQENPLVQSLKRVGLEPEDITDLIISHLHFDHVGGLTYQGQDEEHQAIFPQATIHLHQDHYHYSLKPTDRDRGSFHIHLFKPIIEEMNQKGQVNWIKGEEGDIIKELGIKFKTSFGHTPHLLHPYDENFFYLTDLIPTSNHIKIPWVMGYDIEPGVTTEFKKKILSFIHEKKLFTIFEHDPKYWGGQISLSEKGDYRSANDQESQEKLAYPISFHPASS